MARYSYDITRKPPAPVLPLGIGRPGDPAVVLLPALVDTGADMSVVPESVAAQLQLPAVDRVRVRSLDGQVQAIVYAADIQVAGTRTLMPLVGLGEQALVGRDLLNRWVLTLDGRRGFMEVESESA